MTTDKHIVSTRLPPRWIKKWGSRIEIVDAPHPPKGAKKARKKTVFSWMGSLCVRLFATPISANMMPSFRESSRGHEKFQYPLKTWKHRKILRNGDNTKVKNTKILITGFPRGCFEHLGVETESKIRARRDGNSEIASWYRSGLKNVNFYDDKTCNF